MLFVIVSIDTELALKSGVNPNVILVINCRNVIEILLLLHFLLKNHYFVAFLMSAVGIFSHI